MAKSIIICFKEEPKDNLQSFANSISSNLTPNNIDKIDPYLYIKDKIFSCTVNPTNSVRFNNGGVCLGVIEDYTEDLWIPETKIGDGTFALFRFNDEKLQLVCDYTASRTIWYTMTKDCFIASTSQRMMISYLGDLQFNNQAAKWMLSSGVIGPDQSWDCRISQVPANSSLLLCRKQWQIKTNNNCNHNICPEIKDIQTHTTNLQTALKDSITSDSIDYNEWTLALSGGLDSRSILYYLKDKKNLKSITWGINKAHSKKDTDAYIANILANECDLQHNYVLTDIRVDIFPQIFMRFLKAGEGRIDHMSAYLDGFELWRKLFLSKCGILRGYDAQGATTRIVKNKRQARLASSLVVTSDYKNSIIPYYLKIFESDIPELLNKNKTESLEQWRDRLWLSFRTPVLTAALDEIKVAYVEIFNPLLYKKIVRIIQVLPDELRNNKKLFRKIVDGMFPNIRYAKRDSIQDLDSILNIPEIKKYLIVELLKIKDSGILPAEFIKTLINSIETSAYQRALVRKIKIFYRSYCPKIIKTIIQSKLNYLALDNRRLALRVLIITSMHQLLENDAKRGKDSLEF